MRRIFLLVLIILGLPLFLFAQVKIEFSTEKSTVKLGERIKAKVVVRGNEVSCSNVIFPSPQIFPQDVFVRDIGDCQSKDGEVSKEYEIAVFSLHPKIPSVPVFVNGKEYKTPELSLKVEEFLPKDVSKVQPRDFAPLYFVPFPWRWFWLTLIGLGMLGLGLFAFLRRKRIGEEGEISRPYWEIARERLKDLSKSHLVDLGEYRQFYYELTEILRYIIQRRFGIPAMEMTNSEFISALRMLELDSETKQRIRDLVERSGPVKYAKGAVSKEICQGDLEFVNSLLDKITQENEAGDDNSPRNS